MQRTTAIILCVVSWDFYCFSVLPERILQNPSTGGFRDENHVLSKLMKNKVRKCCTAGRFWSQLVLPAWSFHLLPVHVWVLASHSPKLTVGVHVSVHGWSSEGTTHLSRGFEVMWVNIYEWTTLQYSIIYLIECFLNFTSLTRTIWSRNNFRLYFHCMMVNNCEKGYRTGSC